MSETKPDPRVINETDKIPKWNFGTTAKDEAVRSQVRKIILGVPPIGTEKKPLRLQEPLPDFSKLFKNLSHLYLWQLDGLAELPQLPDGLVCLDIRACSDLALQKLGFHSQVPASYGEYYAPFEKRKFKQKAE